MESFAKELASRAKRALPGRGVQLIKQFRDNCDELIDVHRRISDAHGAPHQELGPEAEWLLDNFHIITDSFREVLTDLPPGYYNRLPKLNDGPFKGYPRVFEFAILLIAHNDSALDESNILRFLHAYQSVLPLTIGELWAIPIMLRLGLVENLRRLAHQVFHSHTQRMNAAEWMGKSLNDLGPQSKPSAQLPRDSSDQFVVELTERLRQHPSAGTGIEWLEGHLNSRKTNCEEVLRREHQRRAANQVSIGNCVTSLRLLSVMDWTAVFEQSSSVEVALRKDPAQVHARQDFDSRDTVRRAVEQLARGSSLPEVDVANRAIEYAATAGKTPGNHVGFHLIGAGRREFERTVKFQPLWSEQIRRVVLNHPRVFYFSLILLFTALFALAFVKAIGGLATTPFVVAILLALFPASELAIQIVHRLTGIFAPPRVLPKLHFANEVPAEFTSFVVVPSMLVREQSAQMLIERIEVHYLSNPDPNLRFAILTDFADAPQEQMPEDKGYLDAAIAGIEALNKQYGADGTQPFFLFHRRRQFNPVQNCWMGWERKRGKLAEFNRLLRGAKDTSFSTICGDMAHLPRIRFVITLDADTKLPRDAARRMISILAHPLNAPSYDAATGLVTSGHGVIQPRISLTLTGAQKSLFAKYYAWSAGIDPYTSANSNAYQDLFDSGSFTGKGIYDVDAFEAATGSTFPENQILSHDLIEGNYARCGLASDIELFDEFPSHYLAFARRDHRWIRGDWQILAWLFPRVPRAGGKWVHNPLPLVERWKIFDNLRRSLIPPALIVLLVLGWIATNSVIAWAFSITAALVLFLPLILTIVEFGLRWLQGKTLGKKTPQFPEQWPATTAQSLFDAVFLLDRARLAVDAVLRTFWRMFVSRKRLLEWETSAAAERRVDTTLRCFWNSMWMTTILAVMLFIVIATLAPWSLPAAGLYLIGWIISPLVAWQVSQPLKQTKPSLTEQERRELCLITRQTWGFFERFLNPEDNWLPPDNYQESPKGEIAHRTSPTNIGLSILANIAAHDFGYIPVQEMVERIENAFATLDKLEKRYGHFFNWYNTQTLEPLLPIYLSTVDSGNLLACFLVTKRGLMEKAECKAHHPALWTGLSHTFEQCIDAIDVLPPRLNQMKLLQDLRKEMEAVRTQLAKNPPSNLDQWPARLDELHGQAMHLFGSIEKLSNALGSQLQNLTRWMKAFCKELTDWRDSLKLDGASLANLRQRCLDLAERSDNFAKAMDFTVLYNSQRHLFSVGLNITQARLDGAHYDLLASEACLTSFLAISRGDCPPKHWFQLGRPMSQKGSERTLVSWGGTMFEYLMPRLFLPVVAETLLDESQRWAVDRQIEYGESRKVPWGISESAFAVIDADLNYQYQAFGVPGLGLKRGLGKDLVVAPYASALAVGINPAEVVRNFRRLTTEGALGDYGFYEAIDYTPEHLPTSNTREIVRCYMAHHQGMSLLALTNFLLGDPTSRRLREEPMIRATELLLQERVPRGVPNVNVPTDEMAVAAATPTAKVAMSRRIVTPHTAHPRTHFMAGKDYTVFVTNSGAGKSACAGYDITRWREDRTRDDWGQFFYLRDLRSKKVWSAGYQPLRVTPDEYEVTFSVDKAEFRRLDGKIESLLEVTVSPEHRAEVRKLVLTNHDNVAHEIEVTSYVEICLLAHTADLAHPAFGKLFLETEYIPAETAILCRRRPSGNDQKPIWGIHVLAMEGDATDAVQFETDRGKFLGRGRTPSNPIAMEDGSTLSGSAGSVLDPVFSIRCRIRLEPDSAISLAYTTAMAESREEAMTLADQYHDFHTVTRAFELSYAHSQLELHHLHFFADRTHQFQKLAAYLVYASNVTRSEAEAINANRIGIMGLWRNGISGDHPILLARVNSEDDISLIRELLVAHSYLRKKGLITDFVILNEEAGGYFEDLQKELQRLLRTDVDRPALDQPGGVFLRKANQMSAEDRMLIRAAARVEMVGQRGSLGEQLDAREKAIPSTSPPQKVRPSSSKNLPTEQGKFSPFELKFANGTGGFSRDNKEYKISVDYSPKGMPRLPPTPWSNVIANPTFGCLVTESGGGYTWSENSQLNRMTPWSNDPVSDSPGDIVYIRDEQSGQYWSVTPLPAPSGADIEVRHGHGYTIFEQKRLDIVQELTVFVSVDQPVKAVRLKLRNTGTTQKRLAIYYYAEWVLGRTRDETAMHMVAAEDPATGTLLGRNPFNADFGSRVGFVDVNVRPRLYTCDRTEFLGRNGSTSAPAALGKPALAGADGPLLDPCAAIQVHADLKPDSTYEVTFLIGQTASESEIAPIISRWQSASDVELNFRAVQNQWETLLGRIQVRTPSSSFDALVNRWLMYQVISCRMWGRTGFYQSGGAFGFRDQLQDGMAAAYADPSILRNHILLAASRQFPEGDVQHWWHPQSGAGVRTHFSDDFLWLPFTVCHYLKITGDKSILDEQVKFLEAPILKQDQDNDYRALQPTGESKPLYDHCIASVRNGCKFGERGLPLMGTGDWNDGMNRVGQHGKGESVWNGWFLLVILRQMTDVATQRNDTENAHFFTDTANKLIGEIEKNAWDGEWYRRAYFDDGTPLGSTLSEECKIDLLPQSWSAISGEGEPNRVKQALESADKALVNRQENLVLLFAPPFDKSSLDPGYVKGYVPGIRENGGQYTHAAAWLIQAFATIGDGTKAEKLLHMINPINHTRNEADVAKYRVEPYVIAADVAGKEPHLGRGGWTWYTGSAGWVYRVALESILGFRLHGDHLEIKPAIPAAWKNFEITYRLGKSTFHIVVDNVDGVESGVASATMDGAAISADRIPLTDDGKLHEVQIKMSAASKQSPTSA